MSTAAIATRSRQRSAGPRSWSGSPDRVRGEALALVDGLRPTGRAEIRRDLAGPLAVRVVAAALDLLDVEPGVVLGWYDEIVGSRRSGVGRWRDRANGRPRRSPRSTGTSAATIDHGTGVLAAATATLARREIVSNAAVMMFGGIETSEGMTHVAVLARADDARARSMPSARTGRCVANAVEESLRLEPAAGRVDRYATVDVELGGATIRRGRPGHRVADRRQPRSGDVPGPGSVRYPSENARSHLAFAQGPHACVGLHLARLETQAALEAALDALARPADRGWRDATDRRRLPQAEVAPGQLGHLRT